LLRKPFDHSPQNNTNQEQSTKNQKNPNPTRQRGISSGNISIIRRKRKYRTQTKHQAPSTKNQAPSTKNEAPRTKHQAPSTKHQAPSTKHQAPSTTNQEPRTPKSPTTVPFRFRLSSKRVLQVNPRIVGCVTVGSTYPTSLNRESLKPEFSAIKIANKAPSVVTDRDGVRANPMSHGHYPRFLRSSQQRTKNKAPRANNEQLRTSQPDASARDEV
jgi:hypothetical protein